MDSKFPVDMHIYMVCYLQLQSFRKFCWVVSEELHWKKNHDWQSDWQIDIRFKNIIPSATHCTGYNKVMYRISKTYHRRQLRATFLQWMHQPLILHSFLNTRTNWQSTRLVHRLHCSPKEPSFCTMWLLKAFKRVSKSFGNTCP